MENIMTNGSMSMEQASILFYESEGLGFQEFSEAEQSVYDDAREWIRELGMNPSERLTIHGRMVIEGDALYRILQHRRMLVSRDVLPQMGI
jgi:hypothetical protein